MVSLAVAANLAVLTGVLLFVLVNPSKADSSLATQQPAGSVNPAAPVSPLDQLSSANIALTVARMSGLGEVTAITNQADSQSTSLLVASASDSVIRKPQVVASAFKSRHDIKTYVTQPNDTLATIASKFGVTSDSIRWSNGLSGNYVPAGRSLLIPPVNGIVYTVAAGDTADSLAQRYNTSKDKIIAFNDAEISGLKVGERIVIPDGTKYIAAPVVASYGWSGGWGGGSAVFGYNGYDYGYCTWYVANRRVALGKPVPANLGDAWTWVARAAAYGMATGSAPQAGAVAMKHSGAPGHVALVETVNADGSFWISEMNSYGQVSMTNPAPAGGWGRVDWKLIPANEAGTWSYIY